MVILLWTMSTTFGRRMKNIGRIQKRKKKAQGIWGVAYHHRERQQGVQTREEVNGRVRVGGGVAGVDIRELGPVVVIREEEVVVLGVVVVVVAVEEEEDEDGAWEVVTGRGRIFFFARP